MKKRYLLFGFIFSVSASMHAQYKTVTTKDANGFTYEYVENDPAKARVYTLGNGLKVYLAQNHDEPRIQTYIPVRTGSNNDPEDSTGLAHYLEHMVFKGTSKLGTVNWAKEKELIKQISDLYEQHKAEKDVEKKKAIYKKIDEISKVASQYAVANEYDKAVASIGATGTNAHTWFDETVYKNVIPSNELEKFLLIESERFSELVLRLFHTELEAVYEEFNRGQDNDYWASHEAMMKLLFPTTHYGTQTTIGTSDHLKNPSMVAINNYFNEYYVPNNIAVVLVGDLEFEPTIKLVNAYFGSMKKANQPKEYIAQEAPLTKIQVKDIYSPQAERVEIGFRLGGVKTKDAIYLNLIDMLLSNGQAGIIDLDVNQQQKALYAASSPMVMKDYSVHQLTGMPNEGQTVEEVKDLLLAQIEKLKKGEFDEWLLNAVVNEFRKNSMEALESNDAMATEMYEAFIHGRTWEQAVSDLERMSKVTKQELIDFVNANYKDNYVVIYKRQGENKDLVRVENPGITPIDINRDSESEFYKRLKGIEVEEIAPVFVDFNSAIQKEKIGKGNSQLYSINNTTNDLATVTYITEIGSDNDNKLSLAISYLDYLGTSKYSAADIKKEFYKLGISYGISTGTDKTYITVKGLKENIPAGIKLLEHLVTDAKADDTAYANMVDQILKGRLDAKSSKGGIQRALNSYIVSNGELSRFKDILSENELKTIKPTELVGLIHNFFDYNNDVFYYGNDKETAKKAIVEHHNLGKGKKIPAAKVYPEPATDGTLYFAPYDMVQAEITYRAREGKFNKDLLATSSVFNNYFGGGMASVVFQEIRESKSLAYSAYAYYMNAAKADKHNYVMAYVGTQANKLPQAVEAMMELMNAMPQGESQFQNAKNTVLKNIATQRYTKAQIFSYWLSLKEKGIDYDINKDIYSQVQNMQMTDLVNYFDKYVKGKTFNVGLLGKKENLDWEAVKKMGKVKELSLEDLFGY
ncbi:insulinase family protein [Myroides odoratimimus]|uniref:M16 family metallopeptidase n=1 Tax=Myroides odoratimimus TaxID=76832 RepID=UPI00104003D6|nr:M16 family metallopeptidase [Myroides odoratimimus]MDM1495658.1 insulinase family protein [Myroides odoratimimus]QBK75867.1 insulinase family protein [Myroides odoratimimus]WHT74579.1 insulinase family protein [Myroides odoratimimus]